MIAPHSRLLLVPDLLIDPPGPAVPGLCVLVGDGRIMAVGREADLTHEGVLIERLAGETLMPGMIDAHLHLEFRPVPDDAEVIRLLANDQQTGMSTTVALEHAQIELHSGVTTVRDCAASLGLLAVRDDVAARLTGPRILACGPPITKAAGHLNWTGVLAKDATEARRATRELCDQGVDAIKVVASGGTMTPTSFPDRPQFSIAELEAIVDEAGAHGRRVVAHALNAEAIRRCAIAGVQSIDHARWNNFGAASGYDPEVARTAIARGAIVGLTASGWARERAAGTEMDTLFVRETFAGHRAMLAAGATVGVHTDAGATGTAFGRLAESLRVAALATDMSNAQLLASVTCIAANSLGLGDMIGAVRPGYGADLISVRGNPLDDLMALERVSRVYLRGELVNRDRPLVDGVR